MSLSVIALMRHCVGYLSKYKLDLSHIHCDIVTYIN